MAVETQSPVVARLTVEVRADGGGTVRSEPMTSAPPNVTSLALAGAMTLLAELVEDVMGGASFRSIFNLFREAQEVHLGVGGDVE